MMDVSHGMSSAVARTRSVTRRPCDRGRATAQFSALCRAFTCVNTDASDHVGTIAQSQCEALAKLVYAMQDTDRIVVANDVIRFAFLALVFAMLVLKK